MNELLENVNWIGVVAGFVVAFFLGWIWYSPSVFGSKWAEGIGITFDEECKPPIMAMLAQACATFLLAWVVGITAAGNLLLTCLLIVATIMLIVISGGLFAQKSRYAIAVESGYILAMAVVMIICQGTSNKNLTDTGYQV